MGRARDAFGSSSVVPSMCEEFACAMDVEPTMECENTASNPPSDVANAGLLASSQEVVSISTIDLKDTMVKLLLLFGASGSQVVPHHELRAKIIGDGTCSRARQQYNKCLLEVSLNALVETGHLIRHGYGSWALYTASSSVWTIGALGSSVNTSRLLLDKLVRVSRTLMAAKLPVAGQRRQRSPLSPCGQTNKRRKGPQVQFTG